MPNLELLSSDIDEQLTILCIRHKISPLIVSSAILARLTLLNEAAKSSDDFKQLLLDIITGRLGEAEDKVIH